MRINWRAGAIGISAFVLLVGVGAWYNYQTATTCIPVPAAADQMGSQGFRIWKGQSLVSFDHRNRRICIPPEWEPVGATLTGTGWALFPKDKTGVLIRTADFKSVLLDFSTSSYEVRLLYPRATPTAEVKEYIRQVTNAFTRVGALYGDSGSAALRQHTVLVTVGLAAADGTVGVPVYPDPHGGVSIFVRSPESARGEELFIHGTVHLYNRFRQDLLAYEDAQDPIPKNDWQELEATWAETAFRTSDEGRKVRLAYLFTVHSAVQTKNFFLITDEPFNVRADFDRITPRAVVGLGAPEIDEQYGHYVLGPLALVATDGLLRRDKAAVTVEKILTDIHTGKAKNFFTEVKKYLPPEDRGLPESWLLGGATIERDLVFQYLSGYH